MKVSVAFITYNHAPYVEQALRSVLNQETDFPIEIIIGDDCSTDGTSETIARILEEQAWPHQVRHLRHATNLGPLANSNHVLSACQAEYVALLEGDDAWTDVHKLQSQANFLDQHPQSVICHHRVVVIDGATGLPTGSSPPMELRVLLTPRSRLFESNFIMTGSVMTRQSAFPSPLVAFEDMGDWPSFIAATKHGYIGYIDLPMSIYRLHDASLWSRRSELDRTRPVVDMMEALVPSLSRDERRKVAASVTWHYLRYLKLLGQAGTAKDQRRKALRMTLKRFREPNGILLTWGLAVTWLRLFFTRQ